MEKKKKGQETKKESIENLIWSLSRKETRQVEGERKRKQAKGEGEWVCKCKGASVWREKSQKWSWFTRGREVFSLFPFFLSFFCDYSSSNFFQHEERSCLFRDTSLFPKVSLSREFLPFLSFFFLFFSIASFKHRLEFPSFIT